MLDFQNLDNDGNPKITYLFEEENYEILQWAIDEEKNEPLLLGLKNTINNEVSIYKIDNDGFREFEVLNNKIHNRFRMNVIRCDDILFLILQNNKDIELYEFEFSQVEYCYLERFIYVQKDLDIQGVVHSVCSKNPKQHLIMFDEVNIYILKINPQVWKKVEKQYIKYAGNDQSMDFYFLTKDSEKMDDLGSELMYLDIQATLQNNEVSLFPMIEKATNKFSKIIMGLQKQRIGFFSSLKYFYVTIWPHRSYNTFFTMLKQDDFVFYKQVQDRAIFLTKENQLVTFDIVSGKFVSKHPSNIDMNNFCEFNLKGDKTIIYRSINPSNENYKYSEFYHQQQADTIANQFSFRETECPKQLYLFREVEIINETEIKIHLEFEYPYDQSKILRLVTNENKDKILITDHLGVSIHSIIRKDDETKVKLEFIRYIKNYPHHLHENYGHRADIFTPDFSKFINTKAIGEEYSYFIENTITGDFIIDIPSGHLYFYVSERIPDLKPQMLINKLQWQDSKIIRIIGEIGIEKLLNTEDNFKEVKFNNIPLFNEHYREEWLQGLHLIKDRSKTNDPIIKLYRTYQEYKTLQNLLDVKESQDYYVQLMRLDKDQINCFNHSFTFMAWEAAYQIAYGQFKISQLSESNFKGLLYAIFPGRNTIIHYLCDNQAELESLLEYCHPHGSSIKHYMPFIKNAQGKTPLHICIDKKATKSINLLLKHLSLYESDHHSFAIKDIYYQLVEMKLTNFELYMESRFQQNDQHQEINEIKINFDDKQCRFYTSTPWIDATGIESKISDENEMIRRVKIQTLDIAGVYHLNDPDQQKFFETLSQSENSSYFQLKSIQALIDFNYPIVQKCLVFRLFVPYVVFHTLYLILIFVIFEKRKEDDYYKAYWIILSLNIIFATYFLANELRQVINSGLQYLKSIWNFIDTVPLLGIYTIAILTIIDAKKQFSQDSDVLLALRVIISIVTLFMWFKFLYFFRIFDKTSYLIKAIVDVVFTMRHFLFVLLFGVVGFGNAFFVISIGNRYISEENEENGEFIDNYIDSILYSYRMLIGDFDTEAFGEVAVPLVWIYFLMFTIFNTIVMLNLLVGVISKAYEAVADVSEQAIYQEKASMIAENQYIIPEAVKKNYYDQNSLILVITDLQDEEALKGNEGIIQKINESKEDILKQNQDMKNELVQKHDEIGQFFDQLKAYLAFTMPQETIQTVICKFDLQKITLHQLKIMCGDQEYVWKCDGSEFYCCKSDYYEKQTDLTEKFNYCKECQFTMCIKCKEGYGDIHIHPLEELTLEDAKVINEEKFKDGWECKCMQFKGCEDNIDFFHKHSSLEILYHNDEHNFDLCIKCAQFYRIKK